MKRLRHLARIALALVLALVLALLAVEGALRIWTPERLAFETNEHRRDPDLALLTVDTELGFVPILGGERYAPHGAHWNEYALEKPPGRVRLLFIGDSVTDRGAIVNGLRAELGDERYEYWNAGVGGYATRQELGYYRRFCGEIRPDHVILTFHMNDFDASPVYFEDEGVVAVRAANVRRPNPWLWQYSIAYRLWFQRTMDKIEPPSLEERVRDLEGAFTELRDLAHERGADLTVLVFPWLRPLDKWPGSMPRKHELVLALLAKLGILHHAFLEELETALAEGVEVREKERDPQHPSPEFGRRIAHALVARGFAP